MVRSASAPGMATSVHACSTRTHAAGSSSSAPTPSPGATDLVHIDVKKIGRIPTDGGWKAHGRAERPGHKRGLDYDYVHAAVDDYCRLAYAEILNHEKGTACAAS